jgi:hypothetical protein
MKKLVNLATAVVIYFALALIIEFTLGWGMQNKWVFITLWAVSMAVADVFFLQPFRKRRQAAKKQAPLK